MTSAPRPNPTRRRPQRSPAMVVAAAVAAAVSIAIPSAASLPAAPVSAATVAPGAPGAPSYFDLARKDCVGTAANSTSKVWFTVADGVLSDVYWPTVDATNVKTLQYVVTDGSSWTDLQSRDMTYRVVADPTGMACTVVASDTAHRYSITTTYLADPGRDAVVMHTRFDGPRSDRIYVRLDPLAGGTGGGGAENAGGNTASVVPTAAGPVPVVSNPNTVTNAGNRSYAVPTYESLRASSGFTGASVGYAGTSSDGLTMLDSAHALTPYGSAPDGHVTVTAGIRLPANRTFDLALGFGETQSAALGVSGAALTGPFARTLAGYESGWRAYDSRLTAPAGRQTARSLQRYYQAVNVVKASEDKTFPGAIAAGLASPWGQAVPAGNFTNGQPTYFGSYREVFARDLYEAFSALLLAGDRSTAQAATYFLFDRQQQSDGSMPRNSLLNGLPAPDTGGLQLDETSYPILMAWESGLAGDQNLYQHHVVPAADFLVAHGPSDGVERWEEQTGYSPSTIAAEIAGLTAASAIATANHDPARAGVYQATADEFARNVKTWTVTHTGPYISDTVPAYFLRLSKAGNPDSPVQYNLGNGSVTVDQTSVVDAGFLELVRLGVLPATDPTVEASLTVVDSTIAATTPSGTGFYRYGTSGTGTEDGYGDCYTPDPTSCSPTGAPWASTDTGSGHLWPVLGGERGEYDVASGQAGAARSALDTMAAMTSGVGLFPEQVWEDPALAPSPYGSDPATASIGFAPGKPAGSASPLTWAEAQYARLALDSGANRDLDTPAITTARYVTHGMPGQLPLTLSSPAPGASVSTATVDVTGTTAPGASVAAEAQASAGGTAAVASTQASPTGAFQLTVPASFGTTTITVAANTATGSGWTRTSVTDVALPGTTVLSVTDPTGDDNGPGTYAYPTASDFQPGAFDLTGLKVAQTASQVYIQASIRNLAPTFGTAFGAQMLDVYVHDPTATSTSTAAAFAARNYSIAPADAWSERVEAQGFAAPVWVTPGGAVGAPVQQVVDQATGTITLILPAASFGTVGSGWVFTVALTGQDGYSPDQARAFTSTPGDYTFGVCAPGASSPICSVDPATVPKVMDTIPPTGVSQSSELNPTLGPVVLQGVSIP